MDVVPILLLSLKRWGKNVIDVNMYAAMQSKLDYNGISKFGGSLFSNFLPCCLVYSDLL